MKTMLTRFIRHIDSLLHRIRVRASHTSSLWEGAGGRLHSPFRGLGGLLLLLTVIPALSLGNQPRVGTSPWRVPQSIAKVGTLFLASPEAGESGEDAVDAKNSVPTLSAPAPAAASTTHSSTSEPHSGAQPPTSQPSATPSTRVGQNVGDIDDDGNTIVWVGEEIFGGWGEGTNIKISGSKISNPKVDGTVKVYTKNATQNNKAQIICGNYKDARETITEGTNDIYVYEIISNNDESTNGYIGVSQLTGLGIEVVAYHRTVYKITYTATESTGGDEKEDPVNPGGGDDPNEPGGGDEPSGDGLSEYKTNSQGHELDLWNSESDSDGWNITISNEKFAEDAISDSQINVYATLYNDYVEEKSYVNLTEEGVTNSSPTVYYISRENKQYVFCFSYDSKMKESGISLNASDCHITKVTYNSYFTEEDPDKDKDKDPTVIVENADRSWLITDHAQLSAGSGALDVSRIGLYDDDYSKDKALVEVIEGKDKSGGSTTDPWMIQAGAATRSTLSDPWLEIDLGEGVDLGDDDLVVFTKRHIADRNDHPTGLRIEASTNGDSWETIGYAYFLYRGHHYMSRHSDITRGTKEYSERIAISDDVRANFKDYKKLRVHFIENNTKDNKTYRLACFNIMRVGPKENYSDVLIDRFHLVTDYDYSFYNYNFIPTLGIFNEHNQYHNGLYKNLNGYSDFSGNGDPWLGNEKDGFVWNKDKDWLELAGVEIPEYKFFTSANDSRISASATVPNSTVENKRQPVHEQEHILYAIPGEPIALYPYSQIQELAHTEYAVTFTHWYDYRTGGSSDYLDFLIDPTLVTKSKKYGYYGGEEFVNYAKSDPSASGSGDEPGGGVSAVSVEIGSADDYVKFVSDFNAGEKDYANNPELVVKLTDDLKFEELSEDVVVNPLGTSDNKFCGMFDGQGHKISYLNINPTTINGCEAVGLFGVVGNETSIKNLVIDGSCSFSSTQDPAYVGLIAYANGSYTENNSTKDGKVNISNLVVSASFSSTANNWNGCGNGALIGFFDYHTNFNIKNCIITSNLTFKNKAGILGYLPYIPDIVISDVIFSGNFSCGGDIMLFPGNNNNASSTNTFSNCYVLYSNISDDYLSRGLKKLNSDTEGVYFSDDGNKIYLNTDKFLQLLNDNWKFSEDDNLPIPFAQLQTGVGGDENPEDPTEEDEDVRTNNVENLKGIATKLFTTDNPISREGVYAKANDYKVGTVATFFYPRTTEVDPADNSQLPDDENSPVVDDKDYIFAADLSCIFKKDANVETSEKSIYEPTVTFRHLFRIKDGRAFAEEFSGSAEANQDYVSRHRRIVSAPSTYNWWHDWFQIRLDNPVPVQYADKTSAPMDLYYKAGDNDYRRIRGCKLEVYEVGNDGTPSSQQYSGSVKFSFTGTDSNQIDSKYSGLGNRTYENTMYQICDDDAEYYRMLFCHNLSEGRFLVRLIGLDINGEPIKVYGSEENLIVSEYDITFLPEKISGQKRLTGALGELSEDDKSLFLEDEENESKFGKPLRIDFDNYRYATILSDDPNEGVKNPSDYVVSVGGDIDNSYFKWPLPWEISTYGFPYSVMLDQWTCDKSTMDFNYNIYMLANNGSALNFHSQVEGLKDIHYLRSLYKNTETNEGFFYWVNAAADPGTAASIRLDELCTGSTIHVTGWLTDTSSSSDFCNMSFNLVAIREDGIREVIHSFVTGDIQAGNWTKVRYEFTPNYSRIQRIMTESPIDHYELELESNAKGSIGADYALDEIRMYVAKPTVEAEQLTPICDDKMSSTDVKIQMPFEPLMSYLGLSESTSSSGNTQSQKPQRVNPYYSPTQRAASSKVSIYYTFLDEEVFNKYYRSQGYQVAFEKAQLQYHYDGDEKNDLQSYGILEFSTNFEDMADFLKLEEYKNNVAYREESGGVRYLTFITTPDVSKNSESEVNYLIPGHKYLIGIVLSENEFFDPDYRDFDILNSCSHVAEFEVKSANTPNITNNGVYDTKEGPYCLGSTPTVSVELKAYLDGNTDIVFDINEVYANESGETVIDPKNYFDWYAGGADELEKEYKVLARNPETGVVTDSIYLQDALAKYRAQYETGSTLPTLEDGDALKPSIEYIREMTNKKHKDGRPMLDLYKQEYQFKPLVASVNDSVNVVTAIPISKAVYSSMTIEQLKDAHYLSISDEDYAKLSDEQKNAEGEILVCLRPIEIGLKISGNAPSMFHGFDDITYPSEIASVPIRIGLRQIQETWGGTANDTGHGKTLRIPIKRLSAPSELSSGLKLGRDSYNYTDETENQVVYYTDNWLVKDGEPIYLIESDDPNFIAGDAYPIVGQVVDLIANKKSGTDHNAFYVRFDGTGGLEQAPTHYFNFREGYTYTMKFDIQEKGNKSFQPNACPGQHVFTIKVVPEYVVWNGDKSHASRDANETQPETPAALQGLVGVSRNWNNDANWRLVKPEELIPSGIEDAKKAMMILGYGDTIAAKGTAIYDFNQNHPLIKDKTVVTDAGKSNLFNRFLNTDKDDRSAFMPMEFTKVVMAPGVPMPIMFDIKDESAYGKESNKSDEIDTEGWSWSKLSNLSIGRDETSGVRTEKDETIIEYESDEVNRGIGDHGHNIHYDMLVTSNAKANEDKEVPALTLRPWYANYAKFVHFKPDTEIGRQSYLRTDKVWVDMEIKSQGWYTVASPLQSIYAGDMYLPTDGARQVSPLFEGIEFKKKYDFTSGTLVGEGVDETINHRFKPAVYQRSWNLAKDIVYEIDGSDRDVFRAINWSHVYNDVKVEYAQGKGYSIKTDVTPIETADNQIDRVLFRFPKEDESYVYYDYADDPHYDDKGTPKTKHEVDKEIGKHGRLNQLGQLNADKEFEVTIDANGDSKIFLVGNPFMSHLDMQKFLLKNEDVIQPKYWIINSDKTETFIIQDVNNAETDNDEGYDLNTKYTAPVYLPPMAGFFVESQDVVKSLTLKFDEEMSMTYDTANKHWLSPDRKSDDETSIAAAPGVIRISAGQDGWRYSSAVIRVGERFSNEFVHAEDAELLVDPNIQNRSLVYTIGDGNALSINSTPDAYGTEIGVFANGDARTTLLFEGEELDHGYTLYDALTGKVHDLYDGFRYEVEGAAASRLFLADAPTVEEITGLRIESAGHSVSVIPAAPEMEVQVTVCDIAGIVVKDFTAKVATTFRLDDGTYVVTATAADGSAAHAKLLIR